MTEAMPVCDTVDSLPPSMFAAKDKKTLRPLPASLVACKDAADDAFPKWIVVSTTLIGAEDPEHLARRLHLWMDPLRYRGYSIETRKVKKTVVLYLRATDPYAPQPHKGWF